MARVVVERIDGEGIYASRLAAGGPFVFMAGVAVDESGRFAEDAIVHPPYHLSPSAQVRAQTRYIFNRYKQGLAGLGSSVNDIVQVEQYIQHKAHADGYLETSRAPGFMERGRPGSALLETGDFLPSGCVVNPTATAIIPGKGMSKEILNPNVLDAGKRSEIGGIYAEEAPYNELVTAGPYVFTVGDVAIDYKTGGIQPEARAADWVWWDNEVRKEAQFNLKILQKRLEVAGTSLENAVHCTVYLTNIEDLYELDLVWKQHFLKNPPARTVVPLRGLGIPRREGARGHAEGAIRMESMFQSIRPGFDVEKEVVGTGSKAFSHESEAVKAGPLLWVSGQLAGGPDGLRTAPDTPSQLEYIFMRLDEICRSGGTTLQNILRLRAYVTDVRDTYAVYAALKKAVPSDPPCVSVTGVPGPLQVPGCSVIVDAVVYAPK